MEQKERMQRITLNVDGTPYRLTVPASQERAFRFASEDLGQTLMIYRTRYPESGKLTAKDYLAMSAIDVAYRAQRHRQVADTRELSPRLNELNALAERIILEGLHTLEGVEE